MKKRMLSVALVTAAALLVLPAPTAAGSDLSTGRLGAAIDVRMDHATDHVLARLTEGVSTPSILADGDRVFGRWYRVRVRSNETPMQAVRRLVRTPGVEVAELDYLVRLGPSERVMSAAVSAPSATPNDPYYSAQWNLSPVQAPAAWDDSTGSGVLVALVDTGISQAGEDLKCQTLVRPFNAVTNSPGSAPDDGEIGWGTHAAGTIAQCTNNGIGVAGLAYGSRLMPVKVFDSSGSTTESVIASGIEWARANGAQVINLSLGARCSAAWPTCSSSIIDDAISAAAGAGIVIVAPSGDDGAAYINTPANNPYVIAVGAVRYDLQRPSYSNYGTALDLVAPGGDLLDQNGDGYPDGILQETFVDGEWGYLFVISTWSAAPHVSAAAAMLRAAYPSATRDQIVTALLGSARDLGSTGYDTQYGNGLLQIDSALAALAAAPPPATITAFNPASGPVGTSVTITGSLFTGATDVRFNDVPTTFTVDSDTQITATVPSGAATGLITVNTPTGNATSTTVFTVPERAPKVTGTLKGFYDTTGRYKLYRVGQKVLYQGQVVPNLAGEELFFELQIRKQGGWKTVGVRHWTLGPKSSVGVSMKASTLKEETPYRIRCYLETSSGQVAAASTWGYFMAKG